jgi:hypothetical protein
VSMLAKIEMIEPCRPKWQGTMTDRERFNRQMHFQPFDRCFNMEFGYWDENFKQWSIFVDNNIASIDEADVFFNFDRIKRVRPMWLAWLINPLFEEKVIEETAASRIIISPDGLLAEMPKDGHSTIPHFIKSSIVGPDDWVKFKEERFRRDDPIRKVDLIALKKEHSPKRDYPLGVYCGSMIGRVRDILTAQGLAYAIYDYPDMVEDMVETCCQIVEDFLDQILGHIDFDYACAWEDICFKNGPLVSVDFFKNIVVPRLKRISRKLRAANVDIFYTDCDGDVRPLLPLFMEAGVNCMFPWEVNGSGHPAPVLAEYGRDLLIMGAVDKMVLGEGKKAIKAYLKTLIPLVERGGFIPFCDHRCPPNVKQGDYLYYLDLKEQMFGLKN